MKSNFFNYFFKMPFYYAVAKGRKPGIYLNWPKCHEQVNKFNGSIYKKFSSQLEAENFIKQRGGSSTTLSSSKLIEENKFEYILNQEKKNIQKRTLSPGSRKLSSKSKIRKLESVEILKNSHCTSQDTNHIEGKEYVDVYTDGACSSNGRRGARAGIGVWFGDNHPLNVSEPVVGRATNNMAEIQAVTVAARQAEKAGIKKLKINTDSKFLINCITNWMPKWKKNGWKTATNKPVINKTELLEMEAALKSLDVKWNHVNGHVGIYGNEMADKLARQGIACDK
ncbi:ribonuclease H1 [Vespa crabro]|uniref:ribonuclease H1 n=1 Tax=Vespa crabro TaxID=7445 RepID=UPI001F01D242|nr:ribonuclease H1 [Vespa crabro]